METIITYFYNEDGNIIFKRTCNENIDQRVAMFIKNGQRVTMPTDDFGKFADVLDGVTTDDAAWKMLEHYAS